MLALDQLGQPSWVVILAGLIVIYAIFYLIFRARKPALHYHPANDLHLHLLQNCSYLTNKYWSTPWIPSGDFFSVLCIFFRSRPQLDYKREKITSSVDGQTLNLDWLEHPNDTEETKILLVLPGITGHSWSPYVIHLIEAARKDGWRVAPRFIRGIDHHDVETIANHIRRKNPKAPFVAVGWSMGACLLTRYLGTAGEASAIDAGISASNPWSLGKAFRSMGIVRQLYNIHLAGSLSEMLHANKHVFKEHIPGFDETKLKRYWWAEDFDREFTIKYYGYKTVEEYYDDITCEHLIDRVKVPLLVVHARDDPLVPMAVYPEAQLKANKHIMTVVTDIGGHTAWLQGLNPRGISWFDQLALEWSNIVISQLSDRLLSPKNSQARPRLASSFGETSLLDEAVSAAQRLGAESSAVSHRIRGGDRSGW